MLQASQPGGDRTTSGRDNRSVPIFLISRKAPTRDQCASQQLLVPKGPPFLLRGLQTPSPALALLSPCWCPQAEDVTRTLLSCQRRDLSHQAGDALAASCSQDSFTMAVACCPAETRAPTPALDCCRDSGFCPVSRGGL